MERLTIIFFTIVVFILLSFIILLYKEIGNIGKQLSFINKNKTNSKIKISCFNSRLNKLTLEINKFLKQKQETEAKFKNMDLEIKQAIVNISHDLRTPLTSIMGYIQLMEDADLIEKERKEYIYIVKKRTKSLQVLINNFYELSRLESNEYKFKLKSLNIYIILCDLIAIYYKDFMDKGIEPILDIDERIPLIIADEDAVKRIISNLIQNMLKYSKKFIKISLKHNNGYIIMNCTNDAPNLKEDDIKFLFQRFFIGDHTRNQNSTGLGLAITKELVEQMGHKIYAEFLDESLSLIIKWEVENL